MIKEESEISSKTNDDRQSVSRTAAKSTGSQRSKIVPLALVLVLTMLSGLVHGVIDGRWSTQKDLVAQGDRLQALPDQVGDWLLLEKRELPDNAARLLRCYGSLLRVYEHQSTQEKVTVGLLYGPRGPIAVHTPEICFDSVGTSQARETEKETVRLGNSKHEFWSVQFAKEPSPETSLEVWYAWSTGGDWQAYNYPRFLMTGSLYKIQLAGPVGDDEFNVCEDFLNSFLPEIKQLIE